MNRFANCWFYVINFILRQNALNFTNTKIKQNLQILQILADPFFLF